MIKGVIFDLDNTLVDFNHLKTQAVRAAISGMIEAGMDLQPEAAFKRIMEIYEDLGWEFQEVFDHFIIEKTDKLNYKYLAAAILAYRKAREAALNPYPFVNTTLVQLIKNGIHLAVVSDAPSKEAWLRLYQLNFHHLFDVVVTYDDTEKRKPAPEPFELALKKMDLLAGEVLMVGDWPERDMVGAGNLGIKTVFAKYGDVFETQVSGATYEINRFDELLNIIKQENTE